ncbi:unnamed protein product [Calypogeia fissa]
MKKDINNNVNRQSSSAVVVLAEAAKGGGGKREEENQKRLDSISSHSMAFTMPRELGSSWSSKSINSSVSNSSNGTPNPFTAVNSTGSRVSHSSISVVEKGEVVEEERGRGRTTAELNRLCELLEEERSKSVDWKGNSARQGATGRGGEGGGVLEERDKEAEEEREGKICEINCSSVPSPSTSQSLLTTPLRPMKERNFERKVFVGHESSRASIQKQGEVQPLEDLSTAPQGYCSILPPPCPSSHPKEGTNLSFERTQEEQLQRAPFDGIQGLLGELAKIGEPPPYFSPEATEGKEEAMAVHGVEVDFASTTDQQVGSNSNSRKEGLASLVELVKMSQISIVPMGSSTSQVYNNIHEKKQSTEVEEVEKKCITVEEKKSLKPWEYELFHGFSQERICYVEEGSTNAPKDFNNYDNPRSSTWEEDLLAGFSNVSLQNKGNNSNIDTHKTLTREGSTNILPQADNTNSILSINQNGVNNNHNLRGGSFLNPSLERNTTNIMEAGVDIMVEDSIEKNVNNSAKEMEEGDNNEVKDKHNSFMGQQGYCHSDEDLSSTTPSTQPLGLNLVPKSTPGVRAAATQQQEKNFQSLCLSTFHNIIDNCLEKRQFLQTFVSRIPPPPPSCYTITRSKMGPIDPHSYTDSSHPLTKHIALSLFLDFQTKIINGTTTLTLERAHKGEIFLDTRDLTIESVEDSQKKSLKFFLEKPDVIKGSLLRIFLEEEAFVFSITFKTSQSTSAIQWLEPSQTAGRKLPYVFTQCQANHARSIFPCQDTSIARIRYLADVNIPAELSVVMSAAHVGRTLSSDSEARAIESFVMEQPIPPYLFALAVGDITYEEVGPRTRIYAEPSKVKAAAHEFANIEEMVRKAEALFGPYDWERFDLLAMPPSFPYGGMENPRITFLNPTIIIGDQSGVEMVAHELAQSWTGNLISNTTANDLWLNEGFTTYAERRIVEDQDRLESVQLHTGIGWQRLKEDIERFKDRPEMTKLKMHMEGVDPDEIYSKIPSEKGFQFLQRLEFQVGRPTFDNFLKKYIAKFKFQSIDTETFLVFLKENLSGIEEQVDLQTWIYGTGIPDDAIQPKTGLLERVQSLAHGYQSGKKPTAAETKTWSAQAWTVYIEGLHKMLSAEQIGELEELHHFSDSPNWEIKIGILTIGANSAYQPFYPQIESVLHHVGRIKYLKPLYQGLLEGSLEGKELALKVFAEAKSKYHPIAQVLIEGLLTKYTSS